MNDILHYRKLIENIIEEARRDGKEIILEKNIFGDPDIMIVDKVTEERCRVRKLQLIA